MLSFMYTLEYDDEASTSVRVYGDTAPSTSQEAEEEPAPSLMSSVQVDGATIYQSTVPPSGP
jgi:hypothetical protein